MEKRDADRAQALGTIDEVAVAGSICGFIPRNQNLFHTLSSILIRSGGSRILGHAAVVSTSVQVESRK